MMPFIQLKKPAGQFRIKTIHDSRPTVRPYFIRSAFPLLACYRSKAGRKKARHFLARTSEMGLDGVRFFGETDWPVNNDPKNFFGNRRHTPRLQIVGKNAPPNSSVRPYDRWWDAVQELHDDLENFGLIGEFCVIATIKNRDYGMLGHLLNNVAIGLRKLYPKPRRNCFFYELINEQDAYSSVSDAEATLMLSRWKKFYPGSLIGCSQGGNWVPTLDDSPSTHRNIHPVRGSIWNWLPGKAAGALGVHIDSILPPGKPTCFNETVHCWTDDQKKEWIKKQPKWAGLSTAAVRQHMEYTKAILDLGISYCFHDLYGMSVIDAYNKPLTEFEWSMSKVAKLFRGQ